MDHLLSKEKERVVWRISYLVLRDREDRSEGIVL